jgi:HlyD family secretion protein
MSRSSKLLGIAAVGAVLAAVWWFGFRGDGGASPQALRFRTSAAERGEVVEGVQANGTVQPVLLVQVGTQISGVIDKLLVDFNSKVKAGDTIAILDRRRLEAQVAQDEASVARGKADLGRIRAVLAQSKADVDRSRASAAQAAADVAKTQALLTQATRDLARQESLASQKLIAASELDASIAAKASLEAQLTSAKAAVDLAGAQVESAVASVQQNEAQIAVGEAAVRQAEAQLQGDRVNLEYATITSPVDGVVVSRNVDVGQTVAASLSAPTLFVIANDLTKVQVQTSVPEADIGRLKEGQRARFTVDAHPDRGFEGVVSQVRIASTTVQNVVTYTVLVDASNPDGLLLPGMTANVTFEIQRSEKEALHVAAASLRLLAPPDLVENPSAGAAAQSAKPTVASATPAEAGGKPAEAGTDGAGATRAPGDRRSGPGRSGGGRRKVSLVYVATPAMKLRAIPVRVGITDGVRTVVEPLDPSELADGAEVVTAVLREEDTGTTNPFAPPRMTGSRPSGGGGGR